MINIEDARIIQKEIMSLCSEDISIEDIMLLSSPNWNKFKTDPEFNHIYNILIQSIKLSKSTTS